MSDATNQQTVMEETSERLAEASPGMMFPRMVETAHHNRQRKNYRRQIEWDRAAQAAAIRGDKPPEWSFHDERDEDDDMGDSFSIAGDTTNHYHYAGTPEQAAQAVNTTTTQPQQEATAAKPSTGLTWLKNGALAAALLGAGYGIPAAVTALLPTDKPAVTQPASTDTDTWHRIEIDKEP